MVKLRPLSFSWFPSSSKWSTASLKPTLRRNDAIINGSRVRLRAETTPSRTAWTPPSPRTTPSHRLPPRFALRGAPPHIQKSPHKSTPLILLPPAAGHRRVAFPSVLATPRCRAIAVQGRTLYQHRACETAPGSNTTGDVGQKSTGVYCSLTAALAFLTLGAVLYPGGALSDR